MTLSAASATDGPVSEPILDIHGLSKIYKGGTVALDDVSLQIRKGEIFALLGPNGAGKTTPIGAVCGMVRPSAGTIRRIYERAVVARHVHGCRGATNVA